VQGLGRYRLAYLGTTYSEKPLRFDNSPEDAFFFDGPAGLCCLDRVKNLGGEVTWTT
jgi:hypothetical protein